MWSIATPSPSVIPAVFLTLRAIGNVVFLTTIGRLFIAAGRYMTPSMDAGCVT
jgi:hypothetical protein